MLQVSKIKFDFLNTSGNYNNVLCINYKALTTPDGMAQFKKDQISSVLYSIGMEKRKDGYEIAKKAYQHYFGGDAMSDKNIALQYAEVWNSTLQLKYPFDIHILYLYVV